MYEYNAKVLRVIDGDTVELKIDLGFSIFRIEKIRLYGINTPELKTKGAIERSLALLAKNILSEWILEKEVRILTYKDSLDKYGRILAKIYLQEECINNRLVKENYTKEVKY